MVHRIRPRRLLCLMMPLVGLAIFIGAEIRHVARADVPTCGGGNCPNCPVNSKYFGYYPTLWRRWPGTEPLPQPTAGPAAEGVQIPTVEPPAPADETEPKSKTPPPEAPAGPGSAAPGPAADPNAKGPAAPGGNDRGSNRLELPSPEAGAPGSQLVPMRINRLRPSWGNELAPSLTESLGPALRIADPGSPTWPPMNFLRSDERRASFQATEEPAKANPIAAPQTTRSSPRGLSIVGDAPDIAVRRLPAPDRPGTLDSRPCNSATWTTKADPETDAGNSQSRTGTTEGATGSLRWVEPACAVPASRDESGSIHAEQPCRTDRSGPTTIDSHDAMAAAPSNSVTASSVERRGQTKTESAEPTAGLPSCGTAMRIPFVPSAALRDPLAPVEPRSLTGATGPSGPTPVDAPTSQLVPPSRIGDIPMPMISRQVTAAASPRPAAGSGQESLSRIDPVAIGKSLEAASAHASLKNTPQRSPANDDFQFADGIQIPQASRKTVATSASLLSTGQPTADAAATASAAAKDLPCGIGPTVFPPSPRFIQAMVPQPQPSPPLADSPTGAQMTGQSFTAPAKAIEASPSENGTVSTADFECAASAMPAKLSDINPLEAIPAPGTGFAPLDAGVVRQGSHAAALVSDEMDAAPGRVQRVAYQRPTEPARLPPRQQTTSRGSSGEAFSGDFAPSGWTSVSDSSQPAPDSRKAVR
jgi:hypothetical protein